MLARGRRIFNVWEKYFLFTSIYSCLHFIILCADEVLIAHQFMKVYRHFLCQT